MSFCSLSLIHFLKDIIVTVTDELFQRLVIRVGTEGRIHQGPDIAVEFDDAVQPTGVGGVDADPGVIGILRVTDLQPGRKRGRAINENRPFLKGKRRCNPLCLS